MREDRCPNIAACVSNDIGDVVRLFYGEGTAVEETQQADARLTHIHEEADGEWRETFVLTDCSGRAETKYAQRPGGFRRP